VGEPLLRAGQTWVLGQPIQEIPDPQEEIRKAEIEALAEQYANDWMVRLFAPLGIKEIAEREMEVLMIYRHQSYMDLMSMPVSRRKRFYENLLRELERRAR
jgi:hypothetical protein